MAVAGVRFGTSPTYPTAATECNRDILNKASDEGSGPAVFCDGGLGVSYFVFIFLFFSHPGSSVLYCISMNTCALPVRD